MREGQGVDVLGRDLDVARAGVVVGIGQDAGLTGLRVGKVDVNLVALVGPISAPASTAAKKSAGDIEPQ